MVQLAPAIAGVGASFLVLGEAFPILNTIGLGMDLVSNKVSAFRDGAIRDLKRSILPSLRVGLYDS
ncbi:Uncharacterised protein [Alloiococcus otitis]|nr:Uncharacterised protein [Alloiococcus otitis]